MILVCSQVKIRRAMSVIKTAEQLWCSISFTQSFIAFITLLIIVIIIKIDDQRSCHDFRFVTEILIVLFVLCAFALKCGKSIALLGERGEYIQYQTSIF